MLVGIHQLHYLPWLRYFEKIAYSDVFVVLDNIQYNKNGWQNRNLIKQNDTTQKLTVPIINRFAQRLDEVEIDNRRPWRRKHWKSIVQNYRQAPYFADYAPFLEATYAREWTRLNDLNRHMLAWYMETMGIDTPLVYASDLDAPGEATQRLIQLIHAVGGTRYYTGAYALQAYLDTAALEAAGIGIVIQHWRTPPYPQRNEPFIPDLSILDLMMHCGPASRATILRGHVHSA